MMSCQGRKIPKLTLYSLKHLKGTIKLLKPGWVYAMEK